MNHCSLKVYTNEPLIIKGIHNYLVNHWSLKIYTTTSWTSGH